MGSRVEDLLSLAKMLDEGKVSQEEYEVVKAELLAAPAEEWLDPAAEPSDEEGEPGEPADEDSAEISDDSPAPDAAGVIEAWVLLAKELPALYRWAGGALLAVILGLMLFGGGDSPPVQAADLPAVEAAPEVAAPGSLGIRLEEIEPAWNGAGIPPPIMGGFVLTPESGSLDSFLYRFDAAAIIAGAYEPSRGAVYALMLRVGMLHESRSDLNSHVCHLLHPYDQACLDSLAGQDVTGDEHEATWTFQGNTWRFSISDDVQTLRVIAPGQP